MRLCSRPGLKTNLVAGLLAILTFGALACGGQPPTATLSTPRRVSVTVAGTSAPPGVTVEGAHWIKIRGAGGLAQNEQIAAVFRPPGPGPFPLVIELHGSGGLKDVDVQRAAHLSASGFVTVAGCWQPSSTPPNTLQFFERTVTFIACPHLAATDQDAIAALIAAGRQQPGVQADAIGLFGTSAGGAAALWTVSARTDIRAVVVDSGATGTPEPAKIKAPVLVLAGTDDYYVGFAAQQDFVDAMHKAGKDVEWHFYEGGRHDLTLDPANQDDAFRRIIDFLNRRLKTA